MVTTEISCSLLHTTTLLISVCFSGSKCFRLPGEQSGHPDLQPGEDQQLLQPRAGVRQWSVQWAEHGDRAPGGGL